MRAARTLRICSSRCSRCKLRCASLRCAGPTAKRWLPDGPESDFQKAIGLLERSIPATRISFTSRSCSVLNSRSMRPLACGSAPRSTRCPAPPARGRTACAAGCPRNCSCRCAGREVTNRLFLSVYRPAAARSAPASRPACADFPRSNRASAKRPQTRLLASSISAISWQAGPRSSSQRNGELSIITNSPKEARRGRHTCTGFTSPAACPPQSGGVHPLPQRLPAHPSPCRARCSAASVGPKSGIAGAATAQTCAARFPRESCGSRDVRAADAPARDPLRRADAPASAAPGDRSAAAGVPLRPAADALASTSCRIFNRSRSLALNSIRSSSIGPPGPR